MNNTKHSVTVKNKKHVYSLVPKTSGVTFVECQDAKISQEFLSEDVPALLIDLPNLIVAEQKYKKAQNAVVHFRLKPEEKKRLEKTAIKSGFPTISSYMRNLAFTSGYSSA